MAASAKSFAAKRRAGTGGSWGWTRAFVLCALALIIGSILYVVARAVQIYAAQPAPRGPMGALIANPDRSIVRSGRAALLEQGQRLESAVGAIKGFVAGSLRGSGQSDASKRPGDLAVDVTDVIENGLIGEGVRLELVRADIADMDHYSYLCHATRTVASYTGAAANPTVPYPKDKLRYQMFAPEETKLLGSRDPISCAAVNFWMVDQRSEWISDSLIEFVLGAEQWGVELWSSVLSASECNWYPCATKIGPALEAQGKRLVVADFGANHGFFGLMAARLGFPVIAVDPQPHCIQYVRMAAAVNGDTGRVTAVNAFLAKGGLLPPAGVDSAVNKVHYIPGREFVTVPVRSGCWGTWPQDGRGEVEGYYHKLQGGNATAVVRVRDPVTLFKPNDIVVLMKIDVEGAEVAIMEALYPMLAEGRVLNIMMELNKFKFNETSREWGQPQSAIKALDGMLNAVIKYGYVTLCAQSGDNVSWDTAPHVDSPAKVKAFLAEGWTSSNVWVVKRTPDFEANAPKPTVVVPA